MTVGNTAAVFAPNLLRPQVETLDQLRDTAHVVNLVALLLALATPLFGLEAEDDGAANGDAAGSSPYVEAPSRAESYVRQASAPALQSQRSAESFVQPGRYSDGSRASGAAPVSSARFSAGPPPQLQRGDSSSASALESALSSERADELVAALPPRGETNWYYLNSDHQQEGPVDRSTLQDLFSEMRLARAGTFVFTDGMAEWKLASEINELDCRTSTQLYNASL